MILGIGLDLVKNSRIEKLIEKFGNKFLKKIYCESEIYLGQKIKIKKIQSKFYAKRFAAKEAFSKAIGLGIGRGVDFIDIEISNDSKGKPLINLSKKAEMFLQEYFEHVNFITHLSLTDESDMSQAIAIISKISN